MSTRTIKTKLSSAITRRWRRARPGSVLILVVALLVLIALIGTAFLSSTQTERYTSAQNSINTEADLLVQGVVDTVSGKIAGGLSGSNSSGTAYRPEGQDMPATAGGTVPKQSTYFHYDSTAIDPNLRSTEIPPDLFLADRIPGLPTAANTSGNTIPLNSVIWRSISWPLFQDSSGSYTFDSPSGVSFSTGSAIQKGNLVCVPTSTTLAIGGDVPALKFYVPSGKTFTDPSGATTAGPSYILSGANPLLIPAADADGDGIADAGFVKVPIGPINGITYYAATRVIDNNSAINVSSAWTMKDDTAFDTNWATNFGLFRSNLGLNELLYTTSVPAEMNALNSYRLNGSTLSHTPSPDSTFTSPPNNFTWYSWGDEIENQLTRRPGNPGSDTTTGKLQWLGQSQSAALAYKFSLTNPVLSPSIIEQLLANELKASPLLQSDAYSPTQVNTWYNNLFSSFQSIAQDYTGTNSSPLRTILTGNNAVSNAVPGRYGNTTSSGPPTWLSGNSYNFGDWVTDGAAGAIRSFVCIQQHVASAANKPGTGVNAGAVGYWAGVQAAASAPNGPTPGMPWSVVPVKTSVNTGTFEQLWLAFAQVMTDSINLDPTTGGPPAVAGAVAQWQPPMQPAAVAINAEQQMGQFRSVIRTATNLPADRLTSSQMLKLRAALAAVNTMDLRDTDDDVTSRHIVLTDAAGKQSMDVEVFGTEKQPYISEVIIQADGTPADTYVAIELSNPYPTPIVLKNWQISSITRGSPTMTMSAGLPISAAGITIPAASGGIPGMLILEDSVAPRPPDIATVITNNMAAHPGTIVQPVVGLSGAAIGATNQPNEIFVMRPRRADGTLSNSTSFDTYDETNVADLVPVDQLDLTGLTVPTAMPAVRFYYRRATDGTAGAGQAWNMIYPGCYDPTGASSRYFVDISKATSAIATTTTIPDPNSCDLGGPKTDMQNSAAVAPANSTYNTLPIELNNQFMAGPNPAAVAGNVFPYGTFARNLDMLQIPFIGAYRIRPIGSASITELNSVTMDSELAYDTTMPSGDSPATTTNAVQPLVYPSIYPFTEQIGRFCPVGDPASTDPTKSLDFGPGYVGAVPADPIYWHYHWAKRLFDYLTVQAPSDDYYVNYDPSQGDTTTTPVIPPKYPGGLIPQPVDDTNSNAAYPNATIAGHSEDTVGVEGLININTAPLPVLAQLPFTNSNYTAGNVAQTNAVIAKAIFDYRNVHGPFQSMWDLYRVPLFNGAGPNTFPPMQIPGPKLGIFSPGGIGPSSTTPVGTTRYDFQENTTLLNQVSNLITTRSDTFTCYVLLQGWRNAGTSSASLAVQRRAAFILDRNVVTPTNNKPFNFKVPTE